MARGNLGACLAITLKHEGGYVDHPKDPGGATNMGITHKTLAGYRRRTVTKQDVRDLKISEVTAIYGANYWAPVNGEMLPFGVDLATFDGAVNSGVSRGSKWLQRAAGVKQDGKVGPETTRAAGNNPAALIRALCGYRLSFVQGLGTWKVFGRGWARRIADIEANAVAMWLRNGAGRSAGEAADQLARDAQAANSKAGGQGKGAAGAGAGGAGLSVGDVVWDGSSTWTLVLAGVLALIALGLVLKSRQNSERAKAYMAEVENQKLDEMAGS
jgi:lysozyme family protein